jgi:hypothetical protein
MIQDPPVPDLSGRSELESAARQRSAGPATDAVAMTTTSATRNPSRHLRLVRSAR